MPTPDRLFGHRAARALFLCPGKEFAVLVISREVEQSVRIGRANVKIPSVRNGNVRLGIEAPPEVEIVRDDAIKGPQERRHGSDR